jgi:hypothetical protein
VSAWIVSKDHIDAIVTADLGDPYREARDPASIGRMLWAENVRSVSYRYEGRYDVDNPDVAAYEFERWGLPPVVVLKALDCYEYQSCETPGWKRSPSFEFCDRLRRSLISRLPGYDAAPWGLERDDWRDRV